MQVFFGLIVQDIRGFYALIFVAADNLLSLIHVSHKIKKKLCTIQLTFANSFSWKGTIIETWYSEKIFYIIYS